MSMFDYVNINKDIQCPYCGINLKGETFQTKEGECLLDIINLTDTEYCDGYCKKCNKELTIENGINIY